MRISGHLTILLVTCLAAGGPIFSAYGGAGGDCHVEDQELQPEVVRLVHELGSALEKNQRRVVRNFLVEPLSVRLDGKKQHVSWREIDARFDEVFGPRVREAIRTGKPRRVRMHTWILGERAVLIMYNQHGKGCTLEVSGVYERAE